MPILVWILHYASIAIGVLAVGILAVPFTNTFGDLKISPQTLRDVYWRCAVILTITSFIGFVLVFWKDKKSASHKAFFAKKMQELWLYPGFILVSNWMIATGWGVAGALGAPLSQLFYFIRNNTPLETVQVGDQEFQLHGLLDSPELAMLLYTIVPSIVFLWALGHQIEKGLNGVLESIDQKIIREYQYAAFGILLIFFIGASGILEAGGNMPTFYTAIVKMVLSPLFLTVGIGFYLFRKDKPKPLWMKSGMLSLIFVALSGLNSPFLFGINPLASLTRLLNWILNFQVFTLAISIFFCIISMSIFLSLFSFLLNSKGIGTVILITLLTIGAGSIEFASVATTTDALISKNYPVRSAESAKKIADTPLSNWESLPDTAAQVVRGDMGNTLLGGYQAEGTLLGGRSSGRSACIQTEPSQAKTRLKDSNRCINDPDAFQKKTGIMPPLVNNSAKMLSIFLKYLSIVGDILLASEIYYNLRTDFHRRDMEEIGALQEFQGKNPFQQLWAGFINLNFTSVMYKGVCFAWFHFDHFSSALASRFGNVPESLKLETLGVLMADANLWRWYAFWQILGLIKAYMLLMIAQVLLSVQREQVKDNESRR